MRTSRFGYALNICAAATLLAACGGSLPQIGAPSLSLRSLSPNTSHYRVVYSFRGSNDGAQPEGSLIAFTGSLYGTTSRGGHGPRGGNGTFFTVSPAGSERVLYRFQGRPNDGSVPAAGLTVVHDELYGTTTAGGNGTCYDASSNLVGCGTIFSVTPLGKERVLHSFFGGKDGTSPFTTLTAVNGMLYGTTGTGGAGTCGSGGSGCGTVFRIDSSAKGYKVLYSFKGGSDGANPSSGLIAVNGVLYGLTSYGGGGKCGGAPAGCGTFFAITPRGTEHVLYHFTPVRNGLSQNPSGNLLNVNGKLYGTTAFGGVYENGSVFEMSTSGKERLLYSFKGRLDGERPDGGLIRLKGVFYGTTFFGGGRAVNGFGHGTIFSMGSAGAERVLYRFRCMNGCNPEAALVSVNGALDGATFGGGAAGNGAIFEFTP